MKKKVNIEIIIDTAHEARSEWEKERDFLDDEYGNIFEQLRPFATVTVPKNCKGESESGASTYKVSVKNLKEESV